MSGDELLALGLLLVGGFLGGGAYALRGRPAAAGVLAVLAALAVAGAVLRLVPTGA